MGSTGSPLTVSLREVWGRMQVGSAHVVPVPLGTDPSLLGTLVSVARRQSSGRRGAVGADRRVLIHDAAEGPTGAGVLRRRPEGQERKGRQMKRCLIRSVKRNSQADHKHSGTV